MYFVFATQTDAEAAQALIFAALRETGRQDVDAATGLPLDPQRTTRWDEPRETVAGQWAVIAPAPGCPLCSEIEAAAQSWQTEDDPTFVPGAET